VKIIIASNKDWNKDICGNLSNKTGFEFINIKEKSELNYESIKKLNPDYLFFPHWSHIIPSEIYDNFECVIFHMTDLPFGRGGSPLQNLISREIYETKISAIKCIKEIDAGPIYLKKDFSLDGSAEEIYYRASKVVEEMIVEIATGKIVPSPQAGKVTYFQRRKPEESNIENLDSIEKLYDYIRMLDADGYPKAFLETGNLKLEFSKAYLKSDKIIANVEIKLKKDCNE